MPGYDARDIVADVGDEWPDFEDVELDGELGADDPVPPDAA